MLLGAGIAGTLSKSNAPKNSISMDQDSQDTEPDLTSTGINEPVTAESHDHFDYNYISLPKSAIQMIDFTRKLHSLLSDLSSDSLNALTTDNKKKQIRICSLNINGLMEIMLGLLLHYMDLNDL